MKLKGLVGSVTIKSRSVDGHLVHLVSFKVTAEYSRSKLPMADFEQLADWSGEQVLELELLTGPPIPVTAEMDFEKGLGGMNLDPDENKDGDGEGDGGKSDGSDEPE